MLIHLGLTMRDASFIHSFIRQIVCERLSLKVKPGSLQQHCPSGLTVVIPPAGVSLIYSDAWAYDTRGSRGKNGATS